MDSATTDRIKPSDYETWETLIRSEQIPADRVVSIMRENPDFKLWYKERADLRPQ